MQGKRDQIGTEKTNICSGELEWRKLLASSMSLLQTQTLVFLELHGLWWSDTTLTKWMSGTGKPQRAKLPEIRSFLDFHGQ